MASTATTATSPAPLLECRGISKTFGGEAALSDVDFTLQAGEVHGLVGANGAGKSTLMKILAGVLPDHQGQIRLEGQTIDLASPLAALGSGIAMVYQELSGIGQLSVAENVCLGQQPTTRFGRIDWARMNGVARRELAQLELDIDVTRRSDRYPLAIRQMVEIARGLHRGAQILILDEPTSALSPPETRRLFDLIGRLRERGVAIIFISHFIEDVLEICDRVTILLNGRRLETTPSANLSKHYVIHTMLGHDLTGDELGYESAVQLPAATGAPPRLVAEGLSRRGAIDGVSLQVAPGECLGLYGFVGAGHQDVAHALCGSLHLDAGRVAVDGQALPAGDVHAAVQRGVALVASDRKQTLVQQAEVYKNVTLAHLRQAVGNWLTGRKDRQVAQPLLEQVGCRPADPGLKVGSLSGGNQQKVVLAKWLLGEIRVLVLDEPTRGMDVGAKDEIMQLVRRLKSQGAAVVLASSEPELLLAHADRIVVIRKGRVMHEFAGQQVDKAALMKLA